jgi:3-hydroxymyristoyl/3-hydroxydecanoyl-(acyl carrier protein) dehydratase
MSVQPRTFEFRFSIPSTHPALPGHFPGHPVVPGALLLDHVLTGVSAALKRPVTVLQKVKFVVPLLPDESVTVACESTGDQLMFSVQTWRDGILTTLANGNVCLAHRSTPIPPPSTTPASGSLLG